MKARRVSRILCGSAKKALASSKRRSKLDLRLDVDADNTIRLKLEEFNRALGPLTDRAKDLVEIAAYVFAADRKVLRGANSAVMYDSWSRCFSFNIPVRDHTFWQLEETKSLLSELLVFITGDSSFEFTFLSGRETEPSHLFDYEAFISPPSERCRVMLFSGGLDSLAGAIECLNTSSDLVYLVTHRSQLSTARTQTRLGKALSTKFPARVRHLHLETTLSGERAKDESQRTRTFLFGAIGYAVCASLGLNELTFYENGITSLNLPRRQDQLNSRASRTTHPKTMHLLSKFLKHVSGGEFCVTNRFAHMTKTDVMESIQNNDCKELISSAVTCSRSAMTHGSATHCGVCFQCTDRRFAVAAAGLGEFDDATNYAIDFLTKSIEQPFDRTAVIDYVRQGIEMSKMSEASFEEKYLTEVSDAVQLEEDPYESFRAIYDMVKRHGDATIKAIKRFQTSDDPSTQPPANSLLQFVARREHLIPDPKRLARRIADQLAIALPSMCKTEQLKSENDLNDKVRGFLEANEIEIKSEFPSCTFACARVIPDHSIKEDLLIESKYPRNNKSLSELTDEIAADITKYPEKAFILFLIYDPSRRIRNDAKFCADIESKRACLVEIIR
jgi:REase_DpnII-MboI